MATQSPTAVMATQSPTAVMVKKPCTCSYDHLNYRAVRVVPAKNIRIHLLNNDSILKSDLYYLIITKRNKQIFAFTELRCGGVKMFIIYVGFLLTSILVQPKINFNSLYLGSTSNKLELSLAKFGTFASQIPKKVQFIPRLRSGELSRLSVSALSTSTLFIYIPYLRLHHI